MTSRISVLIALAMVVGACSDDDGPRIATIDELRVVAVSGDQTSQVPSTAPSQTIIATAGGLSADLIGPDGYTAEPLVARVEAMAAKSGGTGPSGLVVPAGTLIHWQLPEAAGKVFGGTTATDDSAHVINRWAPGTKAGTYTAMAGRLVGGHIVTDATWELVVEPGEVTAVDWAGTVYELGAADTLTIDMHDHVRGAKDQHDNVVPVASIPDSLIEWTWAAGTGTPVPTNSGWHAPLPASLDGFPETCARSGRAGIDGAPDEVWFEVCHWVPRLVVWVNGIDPARFQTQVAVRVFNHCAIYDPSRVAPDACDAYQ